MRTSVNDVTTIVTVREFANLTTGYVAEPTLDRAQVPISAFDWLCDLNAKVRTAGAALVQAEDRRWLKLDNYVGFLETPLYARCGSLRAVGICSRLSTMCLFPIVRRID